ncbi:caspase family protein [Bradyrhizobium quebecense]|uniref:Caspase family protein n=1 Tax=Bradyrhizobium quebecense TaxID=2748629 RepID=A0A974AD75_9BRAD|nr:caspase family protein [Bradyrhizobium quebecense]UGA44078.1 caspase family protein [Bradyrhizobium quebecense]
MAQQSEDLKATKGFNGASPAAARDAVQSPKRKALVVGINDYPPPNALPSCVSDARAMVSLLREEFGFEDQTVLLDGDASKASLIRELQQLVTGCGPADRLVFFFSGHGYRPVRNGVLESALVTQDAQFFEDQELAELMKDVPSGILTIIIDACFSGGMEKLFARANGQIEVAKLKRWISLDPDEVESHSKNVSAVTGFSPFGYLAPISEGSLQANLSQAKSADFEVTQLRKSDSKAILVSACLEDETAAASTSQTNGLSALTYALTSTIGSLGSTPSAQAVIEAAGQRLREIGIKQTPMLKCPPRPAALASHEFILLNEVEGGSPLPQDRPNAKPTDANERDAEQQAVARVITTILLMTRGGMQMPTNMQQKDWIDDAGRIASVVVPIIASLQSKGYQANGKGDNKDWIDDAGRIASVVVPIVASLQSKGYQANGKGDNKDWIDDVGRIASVVVPIVASLQSKAYQANGNSDVAKDWIDDVSRIAVVAAPFIAAQQSKGYRSTGDARKDWLDSFNGFTRPGIVPPILDLGLQADGSTSKDWFHDVARVVQVAGPIVAATLQSKGY